MTSIGSEDLNPSENKRIGAVPSITKEPKKTTVAPVVVKIEKTEAISKMASEIPKSTKIEEEKPKKKKSVKVKKHKKKDTGHESSSLQDSVLKEAGLLEDNSEVSFEQNVELGKVS